MASKPRTGVALGGGQRNAMPNVQRNRFARGDPFSTRETRQRKLADCTSGGECIGVRACNAGE
jgi:hypothetical protein